MLPRKHYPSIINAELQQIEFEIKKLEYEMAHTEIDGEAEAAYKELIDILHVKLGQAKDKLKALERANDENWVTVKADLDRTRNALKRIWSGAVAEFIA